MEAILEATARDRSARTKRGARAASGRVPAVLYGAAGDGGEREATRLPSIRRRC